MTRIYSFRSGLLVAALLVAGSALIAFLCMPASSDSSWGVLVPLTGDRAAYGVAIRDGIGLAVDEINATGGVQGKVLQVIVEDTKSSTRDCVSAFEKLASKDHVGVILGPMASSEVLSVAPLAEKRRILLFTPSASSPAISKAGDYIFRNVPSDVFEGSAMAKAVSGPLKLKSVGILYINSDYGVGVVNAFRTAYEGLGGKVSLAVAYPEGSRDFRTQLQQIKEAAPEALYLVGYKEMGVALAQTKDLGMTQRLLSTAIFEDPEILKAAGSAAEGLVLTSITFDSSSPDAQAVSFTKAYRGTLPPRTGWLRSLSLRCDPHPGQAARMAGSLNPSHIKEALYRMSGFKGCSAR